MVEPSPAGQHSLPSLCQSNCPCAFRPQLKCCLSQEDFPDHTSTADLTPSECSGLSELAPVTPLPWLTPAVWLLSCPTSPNLHSFSFSWEGQAHSQYLIVAHWTLSYECSLLRAPGSSSRREHNSRAEESLG